MVVALLVLGAAGMPVTGLLIRPDVRWARHGTEMFADLGWFAWLGYLTVSVVVLAAGLAWLHRGTPSGLRRAAGAATALLTLTVLFGAIHVFVVAVGFGESASDNKPLPAAVSAAVGVSAVAALGFARTRVSRRGEPPASRRRG
ncbi:hypothetical protein [Amycolatopsis sp. 195334CR]|uniref:hypothetical protein n=1 Tax=Amycolatopsis sp. 195334CR TaxID=2814588 RepID=UPI001A8EA94B|nr:hypothetical protein [Amycolatopsis sp. 195334CR]MBN6041157.1 hypothetical protein [Amycolatopsis sp. 195334CR]